MRSKIAVWISAFFKPALPLFARAARAGTTMDTMITESRMSFFKAAARPENDRTDAPSRQGTRPILPQNP